jgi:hypothetical protein
MFTTISLALISVGSALKRELFLLIKNNFDNIDTRLNTIETNTLKISVFEDLFVNGSAFTTATNLNYFEATTAFTLTNASFRIFEVGSNAGFLEIDIKRSTTDNDDGSFVSVFTTKPKITYASAVDDDETTNQVFDPGQINISPGDRLKFDITQTPTSGVAPRFMLKVYGEV